MKTLLPTGDTYRHVDRLLGELGLNTVCSSARCPNLGECWGSGTATFMILGDTCTRHCRFCAVKTGNPHGVLDEGEPDRVAAAVTRLGLKYVVLTSVDRDDLPDLGTNAFARTIAAIRKSAEARIEILTPDFGARRELLEPVLEASPDVFAHNLETVEALTPLVRDRRAGYELSLRTLSLAKAVRPDQLTKSGIMVGLGETRKQVEQVLHDMRQNLVDVVTIGQYLSPTRKSIPVVEYITPEQFVEYGRLARELGFKAVFSGPLVRSSYHAAETFAPDAGRNRP